MMTQYARGGGRPRRKYCSEARRTFIGGGSGNIRTSMLTA